MSQIKILPEFLANQIAAGEVVERPASVVKELLENALDAGATSVEVDVDGAGTRSIRIIDNGMGMDQDDILLCLERHATSKLTSAEQLSTITTLGFRGEAIPSIASVSKVTITSRPPASALGTSIYVHYGSIKKVHDMGSASGTMIEVRDLFGNVPARRKFLKTAQTELSHIDEVIRSYCLANPEVGFSYSVAGKRIFHFSDNADSAKIRFQALVSGEIDLIELSTQALDSGIKITGFLVPPDQAFGKLSKLWAFVNGRFVKDRLLSHAVVEGMQGFLMKGRRPGGLVFVEINPEDVDVNVHPTKQEVRFRNTGQIHRAISSAVAAGLRAYQQQLRVDVFGTPEGNATPDRTSLRCSATKESIAAPADTRPATLLVGNNLQPEIISPRAIFEKQDISLWAGKDIGTMPYERSVCAEQRITATPGAGQNSSCETPQKNREAKIRVAPTGDGTASKERQACYESTAKPVETLSSPKSERGGATVIPAHASEESYPPIRPIGQLRNAYILCEVEGGLVVVDQHAAQERLIFEELKVQYARSAVPSQTLMFPEMVELSASEIMVLEQFAEEIARLGLDVQEFGGATYVVNAVPVTLAKASGEEVLREIIERYRDDAERPAESRLDAILSGMACKASIKAGHKLLPEEIENLLDQLQRAGVFSHCPHGRPVVKKFTDKEVQKWFYRT
nr:DNA mismatch repair endonuclease MutL [Desulfobulbaceae bacterium]